MWFTLPLKYLPSSQPGAHKPQSFVLDEESQLDIVHSIKTTRGHSAMHTPPIIHTEGAVLAPLQVPRIDTDGGRSGSGGGGSGSGGGGGSGSLSGPPLTVRSLFTRASITHSTPREQLNVVLSQQQQRVLIVDDSMAILKMMKRTLK